MQPNSLLEAIASNIPDGSNFYSCGLRDDSLVKFLELALAAGAVAYIFACEGMDSHSGVTFIQADLTGYSVDHSANNLYFLPYATGYFDASHTMVPLLNRPQRLVNMLFGNGYSHVLIWDIGLERDISKIYPARLARDLDCEVISFYNNGTHHLLLSN